MEKQFGGTATPSEGRGGFSVEFLAAILKRTLWDTEVYKFSLHLQSGRAEDRIERYLKAIDSNEAPVLAMQGQVQPYTMLSPPTDGVGNYDYRREQRQPKVLGPVPRICC